MPRVTSVTDADCFCVWSESAADQRREIARHTPDFLERLARGVGELRSLDHPDRALFHRRHRILRVGLNRLDDRLDLLRRLAGALGEPLHFLGDDGEAASRLAGRRRLDRRIQREHIGLLGDVGDEFDDLADLQRGFAEALDPFRGVLDLRPDLVHAGDLVLHRLRAFFRRRERLLRHARRLRCGLRDLADRQRHLRHRRRRLLDLATLTLRRLEQPAGDRLRILGRLGHLIGRGVDSLDQRPQFLDRGIDRVGDRPVRPVTDGWHGQIAVGQVSDLVPQRNRPPVALVLLFALERTDTRVVGQPCPSAPGRSATARRRSSPRPA